MGGVYTKYFQKALCLQLGFNIFSLVLMLKQLGIVSAIYLKWIQTHRRLSSDLESTKELEQVPKTSPMCNY